MENRTPAATADAERMRSLRRRFLINGTAAVVGAAGTARAAAPLGAVEREVPADATKIQGISLYTTPCGLKLA